ncbi:MAG: CoA ester lyase [Gammaproteobacteria bacterium]|nr:CoA ester lyase [Gammaproteobacteria bacterium]
MTPRRSLLFLPANNPRAIDKVKTLPVDACILDLEDAVAPEHKATARTAAVEAIRAGGFGDQQVAIRINGLQTAFAQADLEAILATPPHAIVIPKAEQPEDLKRLGEALDAAQTPSHVGLWIMAETPTGVLNARALCTAHWRIQALVMGTSDLGQALRLPRDPSRLGLQTALGLCILAAREAKIDVIDGVSLALDNDAEFEAVCQQGRQLGFDGKTLIHPNQIAITNRIFTPSDAETDAARRILVAWEEARAQGESLCVLDGRLIESLHIEEAERTVMLSEACAGRV